MYIFFTDLINVSGNTFRIIMPLFYFEKHGAEVFLASIQQHKMFAVFGGFQSRTGALRPAVFTKLLQRDQPARGPSRGRWVSVSNSGTDAEAKLLGLKAVANVPTGRQTRAFPPLWECSREHSRMFLDLTVRN